jgi:hypothetical protein
MKVLLLVTWFVYGQAPTSYQVSFSSMAACEAVQSDLVKEAARLKVDTARLSTPQVSAVCAIQ